MYNKVTEKCFYDILQYKFNDLIWFNRNTHTHTQTKNVEKINK